MRDPKPTTLALAVNNVLFAQKPAVTEQGLDIAVLAYNAEIDGYEHEHCDREALRAAINAVLAGPQ